MAPSHHDAKWVFTEFINDTGYSNPGLVFLLGLLQAGWTLVKLEELILHTPLLFSVGWLRSWRADSGRNEEGGRHGP